MQKVKNITKILKIATISSKIIGLDPKLEPKAIHYFKLLCVYLRDHSYRDHI